MNAQSSRAPALRTRRHRLIVAIGCLFIVATAIFVHRLALVTGSWPMDFDLNWIAGRRLLGGQSLYNRAASRAEAISVLGPIMEFTGRGQYRSFIGSPFVALQHLPFTFAAYRHALDAFRVLNVVAFAVGIGFVARSLPRGTRAVGFSVGAIASLVMYPTIQTLIVGQGNGCVVLALGVAFWGVGCERWTITGVALGVAAGLKLPLAFLIVYLVLRGRRKVAAPAAITLVCGLVAAAVIGRASDLGTWLWEVLPNASRGSSYLGNQSLAAWLTRLTSTSGARFDQLAPLGTFARVSVLLMIVLIVAMIRSFRQSVLLPQELGCVVLLTLAVGPLSWDHYFSWSAVSFVVLCHPALWRNLRLPTRLLAASAAMGSLWLLSSRVESPLSGATVSEWGLRVLSGRYAVASAILLAVLWSLVITARRAAPSDMHAREQSFVRA